MNDALEQPPSPPAGDENRRTWLRQKLLSEDVGASMARVEMVDRFCDLYAGHGLFDGDQALPLDCACPAAGDCWAGVPSSEHPPREHATVSVPWLGPSYRRGGVAAVAINFHNYGGLGAQWWVRRGANDRLRAGQKRTFDYRAGSYLAMVLASLKGAPLEEDPPPATVADAWDRCAFFEAVKCAPHNGVSEPTEAMRSNCPERYVGEELPLLEPGALVIVGRWVGDALAKRVAIERREDWPGLWRGTATLDGRSVDVLCCNHPSYGHWKPSVASLRESLGRQKLSALA